jgi:hypothetical protein
MMSEALSAPELAGLDSIAPHFDHQFYLHAHPDVARAGVDPVAHFLLQGWREGRDPNPDFDVRYYLRTNPDVAENGINPFLHFVLAGKREGRAPRRLLDVERTMLERGRALAEQARDWPIADPALRMLSVAKVAPVLETALAQSPCLVVSISHDDNRPVGGVQNLIREEAAAFAQLGIPYLHLSPARPLPMLAPSGVAADFPFTLQLGSQLLGPMRTGELAAGLADLRRKTIPILLIVHHLRGMAPEAVSALAAVASFPPVVWVHDYFTVCPGLNLLRNDVRFCGAPPIASAACTICVHGEERAASHDRIAAFFEAHRPFVVSPSEAAARRWQESSGLPHRSSDAQPLARLVRQDSPGKRGQSDGRIRVAHLGALSGHKGWPTFERLVKRFGQDERYGFFHLGMTQARLPPVISAIPVEVTAAAPQAMVEAIARHRIDVVVNWSPWPETFCYAAHEALAGGAFLLTHAGAGNVTALARAHTTADCLILDSENALHALLDGEGLAAALATASRRRGVLLPEGGTTAWLVQSAAGRAVWREMARQRPAIPVTGA